MTNEIVVRPLERPAFGPRVPRQSEWNDRYGPLGGALRSVAAVAGNIAELINPSSDALDDMDADNQGWIDYILDAWERCREIFGY